MSFGRPGSANFPTLAQGEPLLFRVKASYNAIAGVGFFVTFFPASRVRRVGRLRYKEQLGFRARDARPDRVGDRIAEPNDWRQHRDRPDGGPHAGADRNSVRPKGSVRVTISGALGDDAKPYQIRAVEHAIEESKE